MATKTKTADRTNDRPIPAPETVEKIDRLSRDVPYWVGRILDETDATLPGFIRAALRKHFPHMTTAAVVVNPGGGVGDIVIKLTHPMPFSLSTDDNPVFEATWVADDADMEKIVRKAATDAD